MRVPNELATEELSRKNPFEVYYGRIPNNIQNPERYILKQVIIDERIIELLSARNLQQREKEIKKLHERVKKWMDERIVKKNIPRYIKI